MASSVASLPAPSLPVPGSAPSSSTLPVRLVFGGGAELLFGNVREHTVDVPSITPEGKPTDVAFLIHWIRDHLLKERVELFIENDTVRPGILVLINDTDWELEDEGEHVLIPNDEVVFISTLHGG